MLAMDRKRVFFLLVGKIGSKLFFKKMIYVIKYVIE